jgi:hypothetical protein
MERGSLAGCEENACPVYQEERERAAMLLCAVFGYEESAGQYSFLQISESRLCGVEGGRMWVAANGLE